MELIALLTLYVFGIFVAFTWGYTRGYKDGVKEQKEGKALHFE